MTRWARRFGAVPQARARLVCLPHAGGSASAYRALCTALADVGVEAWAVQYPGRQERFREPCIERLELLVDAVVTELAPLFDDTLPFGLFGHSMGAVLAYEVARRLERDGRRPGVLVVSGRQAPSLPWPPPGAPSLAAADDAALIAELRVLASDDEHVPADPALLRLVLPTLRADYRLLANYTYEPGPTLGCPILALAGDHDPRVAVASVAPWESETRAGFAMHVLPGKHFFIDDNLPCITLIVGRSCA
jgi:pyochelin biosynthetic protein PchC